MGEEGKGLLVVNWDRANPFTSKIPVFLNLTEKILLKIIETISLQIHIRICNESISFQLDGEFPVKFKNTVTVEC